MDVAPYKIDWANLRKRRRGGGGGIYPGVSAHMNFVKRRYWWNGAARFETDFDTFTGATFGTGDAAGLTGSGTATNHDITLAWSKLNLTAPFVVAVVFRPALLNSTVQGLVAIEASATPSQNRTSLTVHSTNAGRHVTTVANVAQASQTGSALTVDTNYAMATLIKTDLFRNSVNGATAGTEDTSGSLPTYNLIRLLENVSDTAPFTGAIRHVLFFSQVSGSEMSQTELNTLSNSLASL